VRLMSSRAKASSRSGSSLLAQGSGAIAGGRVLELAAPLMLLVLRCRTTCRPISLDSVISCDMAGDFKSIVLGKGTS
jgi:hypothetical protein